MFEIMQQYAHFDNAQLENIFSWLDKIECSYLAVKHDKDDKADHFHLFVQLEGARTLGDIARQCNVEKQYIERIKKRWDNALAYAFHLTDGAKEDGKYQYDETAVIRSKNVHVSAIFEKNKEYETEKVRREGIATLMEKYGACEISKRQLMAKITAKDFHAHYSLFMHMQKFRLMLIKERNMQVLYLCGESGSGKTTLAKYFANVFNYDYFVSGSGKDVLDGYDKEECIILDDLRGDAFTKAELFKLTDNNTNSSVKSRYNNKDISYCKLMIITSIKTPHTLYNWSDFTDKDETFKQFSRRLNNTFLYITPNGDIWECKYEDLENPEKAILKNKAPFDMVQVFAVLGIQRQIGEDVMKKIYKVVTDDIIKKNAEGNDGGDLPF